MPIKKFVDVDADGKPDTSLSISEIKDEFGGDRDPSLKEYALNNGRVFGEDWSVGFNQGYEDGAYAEESPNNPGRFILRHPGRIGFVLAPASLQPGGRYIHPYGAPGPIQYEVESDPVEGTNPPQYRMKHRPAHNLLIPQLDTAGGISVSDFYSAQVTSEAQAKELTVHLDERTFVRKKYLGHPLDFYPQTTSKEVLGQSAYYQDFPERVEKITFNVPEHVTIFSSVENMAAFSISGIPANVEIVVNVAGKLIGRGGDGGNGNQNRFDVMRNGKDGGPALDINHDGKVTVNTISNGSHLIAGGGGGGAAGWFMTRRRNDGFSGNPQDTDMQEIVSCGGGGGVGFSYGGRTVFGNSVKVTDTGQYSAKPGNLKGKILGFDSRNSTSRSESITAYLARRANDGFDFREVDERAFGAKVQDDPKYAGRREKASLGGYGTAQPEKDMWDSIRAQDTAKTRGAGAGGSVIYKFARQPRWMVLPYTKPDYIVENNIAANGPAPDYIDEIPAGFTNGWIIGHRDGTSSGFYAVVEDGHIIASDHVDNVRTVNCISIRKDWISRHGYYKPAVKVHRLGKNERVPVGGVSGGYDLHYERVEFDDSRYPKAPAYSKNQSNFVDDPQQAGGPTIFRVGANNPKYYHGGGFTKSNGTSSSGDVHKYLYFPVRKYDLGYSPGAIGYAPPYTFWGYNGSGYFGDNVLDSRHVPYVMSAGGHGTADWKHFPTSSYRGTFPITSYEGKYHHDDDYVSPGGHGGWFDTITMESHPGGGSGVAFPLDIDNKFSIYWRQIWDGPEKPTLEELNRKRRVFRGPPPPFNIFPQDVTAVTIIGGAGAGGGFFGQPGGAATTSTSPLVKGGTVSTSDSDKGTLYTAGAAGSGGPSVRVNNTDHFPDSKTELNFNNRVYGDKVVNANLSSLFINNSRYF